MTFYYLNSDNQPVGPMDLVTIRKLAEAGILQADALVCKTGSEDWIPLSQKQGPTAQAENAKPPRTRPPSQHPRTAQQMTPPARGASAFACPDWFPLASMVTGIIALVTLYIPPLSLLVGAAALTLGILSYRWPVPKGRPFSITGISTSSVALVLSLGILLLGAGYSGNPEARAIEKVLERNVRINRDGENNHSNDALSQARYFARELKRIDTRTCPPEFRVAVQDLATAWENAIPYIAVDTSLTAFLEGFVGGLAKDFSGVGYSSHQADLAFQQIKASSQTLHRIAVAHGARIPSE